MKKSLFKWKYALWLCVFAAACAALLWLMPQPFAKVVGGFVPSDAEVFVYCTGYDGACVVNGRGKIVKTSVAQLPCVLRRAVGVDGVSARFRGSEEDLRLLAKGLKLKNTVTLDVGGTLVMCGVSPYVKGKIYPDGRATNIQLAYCDGYVSVGSPLILGGF